MNELDNNICQECGGTLSPTGKCLFCNSRNEKKVVERESSVYRPTRPGAITAYIWIMSVLYILGGIGILLLMSAGLPGIFMILLLVPFGLNILFLINVARGRKWAATGIIVLEIIDIISSILTGFGLIQLVRVVLTFVIFAKNWDWFE